MSSVLNSANRPAFWQSEDAHVLAREPDHEEAGSLAAFAKSQAETRSLFFFQTSGSEGEAKWVGLSRAAIFASARSVNTHLESTAADRWLICLPLYHVGGFSILARCHVSGSSFMHWTEKWDAAAFAMACETRQITLTSLVPTQVFDLVRQRIEAPGSLRAVIVGGGALDVACGREAQALGWPVLQSYGMTETASQVATEPLAQLHQGFDPERLEVLAKWNLRTEEDGRLIVRGPALADGYAIRRESRWQWEPINGELRTRDFVALWQHGARQFLQMKGRESSFVKVKGELLNVAALQKRMERFLPGAMICPLPDPRRETRLVLVWEQGRFTDTEVETAWQNYQADSPPAERLHEKRAVDRMPRSPLGKVSLAQLRAMLLDQGA